MFLMRRDAQQNKKGGFPQGEEFIGLDDSLQIIICRLTTYYKKNKSLSSEKPVISA